MENGKSEKNGRDTAGIHLDGHPKWRARIAKDARIKRLSTTAYADHLFAAASPVGPEHFPDRQTGISRAEESQRELIDERDFLLVLGQIFGHRMWVNIKHDFQHREHNTFTSDQIKKIRHETVTSWEEDNDKPQEAAENWKRMHR